MTKKKSKASPVPVTVFEKEKAIYEKHGVSMECEWIEAKVAMKIIAELSEMFTGELEAAKV
jgi:hypothetical protein